MNRNNFLKLCISAGTFLTLPFSGIARTIKNKRADKGFKVESGKDRYNEPTNLFDGDVFYTKVSTEDSDGALYMFESFRDKKGGPPLHYHFDQDEFWYILEGEFLFKVGEETFTAKKGDSIFGPRMIPHAFAKINEGDARILMAFQPAGKMEANFKAVSKGLTKNMSDEEKAKFREAHGFKVVGPALTWQKSG